MIDRRPTSPALPAGLLVLLAVTAAQPIRFQSRAGGEVPSSTAMPATHPSAERAAIPEEKTMCDTPATELPSLLDRLSLTDEARARIEAQRIRDLETFAGILAANPTALAALFERTTEDLQEALTACLEEIERHDAQRAVRIRDLLTTPVPEYPLGALDPGTSNSTKQH